jgi:hypothetical protein
MTTVTSGSLHNPLDEKYEPVRNIGSGNFGVARLMRNRETRELVAVKLIERGPRVGLLSSLLILSLLSFVSIFVRSNPVGRLPGLNL